MSSLYPLSFIGTIYLSSSMQNNGDTTVSNINDSLNALAVIFIRLSFNLLATYLCRSIGD